MIGMRICLLLYLMWVGQSSRCVEGAKILFPFSVTFDGSHFLAATILGEQLVSRGQDVTILINNAAINVTKDPLYSKLFNFEVFPLQRPFHEVRDFKEFIAEAANSGHFLWKMWLHFSKYQTSEFSDCDALLTNNELIERLKHVKFDIIILDPFFVCGIFLADTLDVQFAFLAPVSWASDFASLLGTPHNMAVIASYGSGLPHYRMTFPHRVLNLILSQVTPVSKAMVPMFEKYKQQRGILRQYAVEQLYGRAVLYLANVDFAFLDPIPLMPNIIPVGGLSTKPAAPLQVDLEDFMQSSGHHGVIVFTLGTYVTHMKEELIGIFAEAFSRIPQMVIWQFRGIPPDNVKSRPNIKTLAWLPQNDLLGHSKTRAFVYHGGNNGLYEALYHAVPIIAVPFFGDQPDIATRIVTLGIGLSLDFTKLSADTLEGALRSIVENKTYKQAMMRQSAILHDRPQRPVERAAFWIEHVIKHGGQYMRSPINDIPWYQYYLLDVILFLTSVGVIFILITFYSVRCVFRFCRTFISSRKAKKE